MRYKYQPNQKGEVISKSICSLKKWWYPLFFLEFSLSGTNSQCKGSCYWFLLYPSIYKELEWLFKWNFQAQNIFALSTLQFRIAGSCLSSMQQYVKIFLKVMPTIKNFLYLIKTKSSSEALELVLSGKQTNKHGCTSLKTKNLIFSVDFSCGLPLLTKNPIVEGALDFVFFCLI